MSKPAIARGSPIRPAGNDRATARAVRSLFAAIAPRYDLLNHLLSAGCDILWRREAARTLEPTLVHPGSLVADLCCGTGDLTLALGELSAGRVLGADFCHPMLRRARHKCLRGALAVEFIEADSLDLPFPDASLDGVTTAFGFRNLANYARGLREMCRVLKPGGHVAILEFSEVRWPIFRPLFRFYFRQILPRLGDLISGVQGPYRYLRDSVMMFPDQERLAALMREEGFIEVSYRNLTGGVSALHTGRKPQK